MNRRDERDPIGDWLASHPFAVMFFVLMVFWLALFGAIALLVRCS